MDSKSEPFDTEGMAHCPNDNCPFVLFITRKNQEGDLFCFECDEVFDEEEAVY